MQSETRVVLSYSFLFNTVFLLLSFALRWFSLSLLYGMALGTVFAILNFVLLGRTVEIAVEKPPEKAQRYMALQYFWRMGLTAVVIIIAAKVDFINPLGVIVPLFYPKLALTFHHIFRKEAKKQ